MEIYISTFATNENEWLAKDIFNQLQNMDAENVCWEI